MDAKAPCRLALAQALDMAGVANPYPVELQTENIPGLVPGSFRTRTKEKPCRGKKDFNVPDHSQK